ncbi:DUF262 domain-containing protein [Vibrio gazogenes]|uniref:GmrSD restriction endonucleases N-terminal domain-containing protein n=1 Tax=Vibrio gazogenes DSM 21264 = NBRC 103151 TaxID=1123492 RepID=A0A1M5EMP9_VIBGA|nr:DUF262 domain-containing protein [Vibrio gazogenes]USP12571.1 DUF262 domain-containing protein [Vibrio gazogenes]SHF80558.1 Protein of unknown function DUF262 [Vibrio gazogenes DSM 21264] [Vibrio gazogenes DSM 21264 = NBRC 103151]SJN54075.1 hypothetical protein BQ6471_00802 [Vibrio gazogenes]
MSLEKEIKKARKEIVSDGYDMSLGEVMNLYKDDELKINPEFQRLFRWDVTRKTRFIESILLSIPIPPIFVFQDKDGNWELIDGLQRLSTILEFSGVLKGPEGEKVEPSTLEGTKFLPSLSDKRWQVWNEGDSAIDKSMQMQIKRARIRVEILLKESDENAKYELFQRLNTGGAQLSEQEVRNCVAVMINAEFYKLLKKLAEIDDFTKTVNQTEKAVEKQAGVELVLRFFAFKHHPYKKGLDVHEYLDEALVEISKNDEIDWGEEETRFKKTFSLLNDSLGDNAFKRWGGHSFGGKFLMSLYETIAFGISQNLDEIEHKGRDEQKEFVITRAKDLWSDPVFEKNSGAGIRGTTRLSKLLPMAKGFFKP